MIWRGYYPKIIMVIVLALLMSMLCGAVDTAASTGVPLAELEGLDLSEATENETGELIELFLSWLFTSNCNDRNDLYKVAMEQIEKEIPTMTEQENISGIIEYEGDPGSLLWDEYYGPVLDIVSSDMLEHMKTSRMPLSYDSFHDAAGVTVNVIGVEYDNETTSPFTDGTIYDFDVTVKVDSKDKQNSIESYYHKGDDGKYHILGQITVYEGKITKLYIR